MASPKVTFVTGTAEVKRREKPSESTESSVTWTADGKCTCCPYGYHIDLDFIQYCEDMASGGTLKQLKRIQRTKRKLRKSMEVMLQQQEHGAGGMMLSEAGSTPPPDVVHSTEASRLMHMVNYEQSATHRLLHDIDSTVDQTIASIDQHLVTGTAQTRPSARNASTDSDDSPLSPLAPTYTARFTAFTGRRPSPTGEESSPLATSLSTSGRTDSLSSLSSVSTISSEAPQLLGLHQAHATAQSAYTATLSAQLAATMETHLPNTEKFAETTTSSSSSTTVDISRMSVKAIREAMTASLRRLRELEEQVKALPILQVRVSVLKEEKRLLMLQLRAKQGKPAVRHVGVGEERVDLPETSFATQTVMGSPRSFDYTDTVTSVRSFSSTSSRVLPASPGVKSPPPTLPKPKRKPMVTVGVGDHDVTEPYLLQPALPTGFTTRDHQVSTEIRTHVFERETLLLGQHDLARARLASEPEMSRSATSTMSSSFSHAAPHITINQIQRAAAPKPLTRSIGIGDNNVFDSGLQIHEKELRTVILGQAAPTTKRNVGVECRVPTRDVGVTYCCEERRPDVRSVGVNVDTGSILTSLSFKGEELRTALRDALHRSVRTVGEQCDFRPASVDAATDADQVQTSTVGVGDDRVDVTVRAHSATRTIGVGAYPNVTSRSCNTEKGWLLDASTNTPTRNHSHKYTLTDKPKVAFNSTNTDTVHGHTDGVQTDVRVFLSTSQLKEAGSNTPRGHTRDTGSNTESRPLTTHNFDFEITFVDQGTNTDVTSSGLNNNAEDFYNKNKWSTIDHRDVGVSEDKVDSFVCSFDEATVQQEIQALQRSLVESQSPRPSPASASSSSSTRTVTRTSSSRSDSQSSDGGVVSPRTNRFGFRYGAGQAASSTQKSEKVVKKDEPVETTITEEYTVYHTEEAPMRLVLNSMTSSRQAGATTAGSTTAGSTTASSTTASSDGGQMHMEVPTSPTITRRTEFSTETSGVTGTNGTAGLSSSRRTSSSSSSSSGGQISNRASLSPTGRDGQGSRHTTTETVVSGGSRGSSSRTTTTKTVVTSLQSGHTVVEPEVTEHHTVRTREVKGSAGLSKFGGLSAGLMDLSALNQDQDRKGDKAAKRRSFGEAEERMTSSKTTTTSSSSSSSRSSKGSKSANRNSLTGIAHLSGSVEDFMPPNMRKFLSTEDLDGSGAKTAGQTTTTTTTSGGVDSERSSSLTTVTTTRTVQNGEMVTVKETRTVKDGKETVTREVLSGGDAAGVKLGDVSVVSGGGSSGGYTESRRISNLTSSSQGDVSAADSGFGSMETRHAASFGNVSSGEPTVLKSIMKRSKSDTHVKKGIKFAESVTGGELSLKKTAEATHTGSSSEDEDEEEEGSESDGNSSSSYEEGSYDGREGSIVYECQDDQAIAKGVPGAKMFDQNIRDTYELSKEMREACEVMARYLVDSTTIQTKELNASQAVLQAEWFSVSSQKLSSPHQVEDYLSSFNEISRRLLEFIVNMTDAHGNTALHFAVSHQNFEIVGLLLDTGAVDVNKYNGAGYTALMLTALASASADHHTEICRRIFAVGDVNAHSKKTGQTALMLAATQGHKSMVQLLLDAKAGVNEQDNEGSTALMCACEHGHTAIVKLMLAVPGLNADIKDNDGSTAFTVAMEAGQKDIGVIIYAHLNFSKSSQTGSLKKRKSSSSPTPSI